MVLSILAEPFELKYSLINMMTSGQFFELEKDNPHDYIRWFNKITSTIKYKDVPNSAIKLMLFPFSLAGAARRWLEKEPPRSIITWEDLAWDRYKDLLHACPHHGFIELHQLDTFYNALNPADQDSLNSTVDGNLLERHIQDVLTIIENKSKVPNSRNKLIVSQVKSSDVNSSSSSEIVKLTHAVNKQITVVTTAMTTILKKFQVTPPPASVKVVEEICVTCGGAHPYYQCLTEYTIKTLGNFVIPCGFSELKCKALANLGASINLIPFSIWKKLGLPELISTRMTLELANQAICSPAGIARDVFVPVGKFTFPADFVIVDYESDPRVSLFLGRPFLRTVHALIDVHGEDMILCNGDERLTLNMRHDTSSYSNQPQKESINMINIFNDSNLPPPHNINPLSGNTTSSSSNHLLEEFVDELALITFLLGKDDLPFDIKFDLKEIEYLLKHDPIKDMDSILEDSVDENNLANLNDNLVDTMPEMFTDKHALDYASPLLYDEYDDDLFEVESDTEYGYDDPFDSKGEKIKETKLLVDELDLPRSSDFLHSPDYDSFLFEDFSEVDALPSTNNEDKVFNPGIPRILKNRARGFVLQSPDLHILSFILGIQYPNLID
uniref:Reverse transcriptase domain-containing protein n=1 Tax=Tanacetum cinerariifolium TaxID=118510 RepID=A0A6L2LD29_TANCI|nr:reverse transcriptase domain-containing protein [Tanacetum cinerariifolium]